MAIWKPHPGMQENACKRWEFEVFLGGAAGPGKTDIIVMEALRYIDFPTYRAVIMRRTFPELEEIIDRTKEWYPAFDGEYREGKHRWYFPSGATVNLSHMQHEDDKKKHQGKEYQYIGFDESTHFTPTQYLYLFSRARTKDARIPVRVRAASNPGGISHQFFKERFKIGLVPPGTTIYDERTGLSRVFVPGLLDDNPTLMVNDPTYLQRLDLLPEIERQRLRYGVWDAFEGQVFSELNREVHGIEPFDIPPEWERFRTFDWGYSAPFSVGWWAVDFDGRLYRYREWYGGKDDGSGTVKGLRLTDAEIARGIREREQGERVRPGPADPSIWSKKRSKDGVIGPSTADEMAREGVHWIKADNDRIAGKRQVHSRLKLDEEGRPSILAFNTCRDFWRTLPLLQEDPSNPEDCDTSMEDHCFSGDSEVWTESGITPISKLVGTSGKILTIGAFWTNYHSCRMTSKQRQLVRVVFENGYTVTCTKDHRFLNKSGLWIEAKDLTDEVCYASISPINQTIGDESCESMSLVEQFRNLTESDIISAAPISREMGSGFTGLYGNSITGKSLKGSRSTTTHTTEVKTKLKNSNSSLEVSIVPTMSNSATQAMSRNGPSPCELGQPNGTVAMTGSSGTRSSMKSIAKTLSIKGCLESATIAEKSIQPIGTLGFAPITASLRGGGRISPTSLMQYVRFAEQGLEPENTTPTQLVQKLVDQSSAGDEGAKVVRVEDAGYGSTYCLVADHTHAFALGNGVIVHNCYDEVRYACMFKPIRPRPSAAPDTGSFQHERRKYIKARQYAARNGCTLADAYRKCG